ncbi:MAG: hypothetical protein AMJ54_00625 [Deltaproteobacteria bacterium SG8_13]|nr:MAG: hypothetical protein AMJ54_00625 [Deltaproteobacteria bacterium SG8_13]
MKRRIRFGWMVVFSIALLIGLPAGTLKAAEGFHTISTQELKTWMESTDRPTLVFSLSEIEYREVHIPGSICITMELMEVSDRMPDDRNSPIVFYCHGPG